MKNLGDARRRGGPLPVLEAIDPHIGWVGFECERLYTDLEFYSSPYCGLKGDDLNLVKRLLATPGLVVVLAKFDGTHAMFPLETPSANCKSDAEHCRFQVV